MKGFSLLEIILYMALMLIMFTGLFTSVFFLHDSMLQSGRAATSLIELLNARDAADIGTHPF